jgi:hypothetical protein
VDEPCNQQKWPALDNDHEGLLKEIFALLTVRAKGNQYAKDGHFAANIAPLPVGLRAMAATHCLTISLTLDSTTWHFGNFGEPHLVAETEAGLRELGLHELAPCFSEAKELMLPVLAKRTDADDNFYEFLNKEDVEIQARELNKRAWALDNLGGKNSIIYNAWVRYTRQHPEKVFGF